MRAILWAVAFTTIGALPARAQSTAQPATVTLEDGATVPKRAEARRLHLLGLVEIYSLAVYVDGPTLDRAHVLSPEVPKALRIVVTYKEDLRRRVQLDWRRELVPRLEPAASAHLRGAFAPLRHGDVVLIEYVPGKGTAVRVNRSSAVTGANHDLMLAFLDHWIGQLPVSEEIKRALVGPS
jgi:hypothetical protein